MRRCILLVLLLGIVPYHQLHPQSDPLVDSVVGRYVEARGGWERLRAITSLTYVSYPDHDIRGRVRAMIKMRPGFFLVGCTAPTCGFAEGLDADGAWDTYPRVGRSRRIDGEAERAVHRAGEFDDAIIGWREKGHQVRSLGERRLLDRSVHVLDVRYREGGSAEFYLDTETHLILGVRRAVPEHARGPRIDALTVYEDWRPVRGDVLYPHRLQSYRPTADGGWEPGPREEGWHAIIANLRYTPATFAMPTREPTPFARLSLEMYAAAPRVSLAEFVAMYRGHTGGRPDTTAASAEALNWLGYELLKQDNFEKAFAAFELYVADHPNSADAHDSQGDGFAQAGRRAEAIAAYRRALALNPRAEGTRRKLQELSAGG